MKPVIGSSTKHPLNPNTSRHNFNESRNLKLAHSSGPWREVAFWLLLLGSWQFLSAGGARNGTVGVVGTIAFLVFAARNLTVLTMMGFAHAAWRGAPARRWGMAAAAGAFAGVAVFCIADWAGVDMTPTADWQLVTLQISLGPILEEIVFRGYLFSLLISISRRALQGRSIGAVTIGVSALLFSAVHVAQPGGTWLQFWCILATGALYGAVREGTSSSAVSAAAHAAYNISIYVMGWLACSSS